MGGFGSGREKQKNSKLTVEECLALDVGRVPRHELHAGKGSGILEWKNLAGEKKASVCYSIESEFDRSFLHLSYTWNEREPIILPIRLSQTEPILGGVRWWFICPLIVGGVICGQRVAKLFLHGRYFGCRRCHQLTYRSSQEAHKNERYFDWVLKLRNG